MPSISVTDPWCPATCLVPDLNSGVSGGGREEDSTDGTRTCWKCRLDFLRAVVLLTTYDLISKQKILL